MCEELFIRLPLDQSTRGIILIIPCSSISLIKDAFLEPDMLILTISMSNYLKPMRQISGQLTTNTIQTKSSTLINAIIRILTRSIQYTKRCFKYSFTIIAFGIRNETLAIIFHNNGIILFNCYNNFIAVANAELIHCIGHNFY